MRKQMQHALIRALILFIQTLGLYKLFTYLLTQPRRTVGQCCNEILTCSFTTSCMVKEGLWMGPDCSTSSYLRSLSYSCKTIMALLSIGDPNCRRSRIRFIFRWYSSASLGGGRFFLLKCGCCTAATVSDWKSTPPLAAETQRQRTMTENTAFNYQC